MRLSNGFHDPDATDLAELFDEEGVVTGQVVCRGEEIETVNKGNKSLKLAMMKLFSKDDDKDVVLTAQPHRNGLLSQSASCTSSDS